MGKGKKRNKKRKGINGICPKCFYNKRLTNHHVLPRRFFGGNDSKLLLCRECHDEIELILPEHRELLPHEYYEVTEAWLKGQTVRVFDDY